MPKRACVWAAAFGLLIVSSAQALAYSTQEVEAAAARAIKHRDIQADLPKIPESSDGWTLNLPDIDTATWILWGVILLGVLVVVYPLRDQLFWGRMRNPEDWDGQARGANGGPQESQLTYASAQAEEFAAQGRYREAIHLLLLHALNEMRQRSKARFADSLTSREILRAVQLPAEGGAALHDLIGRVERSFFGEYPTGAEDYAACRVSFDAFKLALDMGGRA